MRLCRKGRREARLKPSADAKVVELDVRTPGGRNRSVLLHRLRALGVQWGTMEEGRGSSGTFRETWALRWEPELTIRVIELSAHGTTVRAAAAHRGAALVEIMQDCPIFNDGSFDALRKEGAEDRLVSVKHGEPITFGTDGAYCVVKSGFGLEVAKTADVSADEIVVHDATIDDPAYAFALSRLSEQNLEHTVMGIFRQVSRPTYDEMARNQVTSAMESRPHDTSALQSLLRGKDTWNVE
jgi:2-oxoglutarate ferredoxin oxidoreductase subunit beta